jgi:hypothetical protein
MAGVRAQARRRSSVTNTNEPVVLDDATLVEVHAVGGLGRWPCRHGPVSNADRRSREQQQSGCAVEARGYRMLEVGSSRNGMIID